MSLDLNDLRREERKSWLEYCAACRRLEDTPASEAQAYSEAKRDHDGAKSAWEIRSTRYEQALIKAGAT